MKNTIFTGAAVAIITPMDDTGAVDYNTLGDIIDDQIAKGTDAIVICGTTGESSTLTDEEHHECIRFTVEKVAKRVPVIAGTGSNDTAYAVDLSKRAEAAGADALLLVTPYYNKTSQRGLVAHYTAVADAVNLPCILYNVPSRTGVNISLDTYKTLAKHRNIAAAKEASGNISAIAKLIAECGDDIDIYSGNDDQIVPIMSLGGKGVISVLSNVVPDKVHEMTDYCLKNNFAEGARLQLEYLELANALFCDVNPIPVKAAMNLMGWKAGQCRLPLIDLDDDKKKARPDVLGRYGLLK